MENLNFNRPILSEKEKLAQHVAGETTSMIMTLDGSTAEDVIEQRNINNFNNKVDAWNEKFDNDMKNLEKAQEKLKDIENLEIMPIGNYVLCKQFETNPFQRIVRNSSGLIIDAGGWTPTHNNTDSGQEDEEDTPFIFVGLVQEVGPECKWTKPGDAIFYAKPSAVPVPFYKQQLVLINEGRILSIVNEGLSKRFDDIKYGGEIALSDIPEFLGDTIEERLEKYIALKKRGIILRDVKE